MLHVHAARTPACTDSACLQLAAAHADVSSSHSLLIQWGEEKLALAIIASDLVDHHMTQLDGDIGALQSEVDVRPSSPDRLSVGCPSHDADQSMAHGCCFALAGRCDGLALLTLILLFLAWR